MSNNNPVVEIKIECDQVPAWKDSNFGLMLEVNAPKAAEELQVQRDPKALVFVVDRSGSMGGGRIEMVKQTILDILGRLSKNDFLSIVAFAHQVDIVLPLTRIGDLHLASIRRKISEMNTGGQTNLEQGYRHGLAEAAKAAHGVKAQVILLSDGKANAGICEPALLGQIAAQATEHMINTSTIGIGQQYDELALVKVSETGGGNHFAGINQDEAAFGMVQEVDGLLQSTITDVRLELKLNGHLLQGSKISSIQPIRTNSTGHSYVAVLGDLASEEERNFVWRLDIPFLEARLEIASGILAATVSYTLVSTGERVSVRQVFTINSVPESLWIEPARNEDIVMELANLRAQEAKQEAIRLMRAGREAEARRHLREAGADLEELEVMSAGMSNRNRMRAQMARREFEDLQDMQAAEFIKRGEESVKRGRESKPDPRKRQQGDA